jgi:hypothetical protein
MISKLIGILKERMEEHTHQVSFKKEREKHCFARCKTIGSLLRIILMLSVTLLIRRGLRGEVKRGYCAC